MNYFKIIVWIAGRERPLYGIRRYPTDDYNKVRHTVEAGTLKYYSKSDIIKIDVWQMPEYSDEVQEYLKRPR